jgi:tetratricopeptide (TPR) repeat protein
MGKPDPSIERRAVTPRRLKVDYALGALPEVDDVAPLREALVGASREDGERAWAASEAYATVDARLVDAAALEARIAALAEQARARVEAVLRHSVASLRALERGDASGAARALAAAGEVEEDAGRLDAAAACYERARDLGRKPRDRAAEGLALRRLARVARARGELDEALRLYLGGYEVALAQRDAEGAVVACQGVGNVYVDRGEWEPAREWYRRGLSLVGEETPSRALWQLCSNLAVVARRMGDLDESEAWIERAARVVEALGDAAGALPVENGRARLLEARGDCAAAEAAYRRSLEAGGSPSERATVLSNLADCLLADGRAREAEAAARELERTALVHGLTPLLPHAYRTLGGAARARGDGEAFVFYEQALDLCRAPGSPAVERAQTQREYARWEASVGRAESAAARLEEALAIYRRLGAGPEAAGVEAELAALRPQLASTGAGDTDPDDGER